MAYCDLPLLEVYKKSALNESVYFILTALTLFLLIFGLYNIQLVIRKRGKFANSMLFLFYIFSEITLFLRLSSYIYIFAVN